jgi:general secretion pathway protein D
MLDIEILEINRSKALEFGLRIAEQQVTLGFEPAGQIEDSNAIRLNRLASIDSSDFTINLPNVATYRLFKSDSEARLLAAPKLRASEGQPAELRLGQEIPIPVTSFVSQFGTPGGVPTTPVTSFQYRNVGVNVTITPKVFVDGEIELQLTLETSSQLDTRVIGGIELPVFGLRNVNNVVRLRDGETNIVGGLISDEDRKALSGFPGIVDIPLLNKIFAFNDQERTSNDVVFSITPHIIRAPRVSEIDLAPLPMGTEQQIRVPGNRPRIFDAAREAEVIEPEEPAEEAAPEPPEQETEPEAEPPAPVEEPPSPEVPPVGEPEPPPPPSPISVLFSPATVALAAGESVDVVLVAGGAQGLSSGEIVLGYDPAALSVSNVQAGAFLTIDGRALSFVPTFNPGQVRVDFSRPGDVDGLRGSGHLVRLTLQAVAAGPPLIVSATGALRNVAGETIPASFASLRVEVR